MKTALRVALIGWVLAVASPRAVAAQPTGPVGPVGIVPPPHDGDCSITVNWPAGTDVSGFRLLINGQAATKVGFPSTRPSGGKAALGSFVVRLADPLRERDDVLVSAGTTQFTALVLPAMSSAPAVESCSSDATSKYDERSVFEASGFVGSAFDNFAPNSAGGYANPAATAAATTVKSRWTAGVIAQYRLVGRPGDTYQLWLSSYTLHGIRTADVDCSVAQPPPVCNAKATTAQQFLYVVEHASSLEAHVDAHFEFFTLQRDSEMPIKIFAAARFGFLDLEGAPQVYNSNSLGVGILAPKGVFRNSLAQVGWGVSEQFGSDPRWNRLKVNGLLAFDLMPGLKDQLEFWKRFGGSTRFFVEISVDRNLAQGPDAVQTYVGLLFDLRQAFGGM